MRSDHLVLSSVVVNSVELLALFNCEFNVIYVSVFKLSY